MKEPSEPGRLPPGQQWAAAAKWPAVGEAVPAEDDSPWTLSISGCVAAPRIWTLAELQTWPLVDRVLDLHCVTRWSKWDMPFRGIRLADLLAACQPLPNARFISFVARSNRRHSSSLSLDEALTLDAFVALEWNGAPLPSKHGGPLRIIVPGRYLFKSVKWLTSIELLEQDRLGYWEGEAGYHNHADPWREERFFAPDLDRRVVAQLLERLDWTGREIRGLDLNQRSLVGLVAREAILRDANFSQCDLSQADFSRANLSNARLTSTNLTKARFLGADVEGADFRGADLRGADFRGASLLGVSFTHCSGEEAAALGHPSETRVDASTRFSAAVLDQLTPRQRDWLFAAGATLERLS